MSSSLTSPKSTSAGEGHASPSREKGKTKVDREEVDDDDDDEDEDGEEDEDEEDEEEEDMNEVKPENILPRRTRGKRVDYSSAEAHAKAGLPVAAHDEDVEEEEFKGLEDEMEE